MVVGLRLHPLSSLSCLVEVRCLLARAPKEISLFTSTEEMLTGALIFFGAVMSGLEVKLGSGVMGGSCALSIMGAGSMRCWRAGAGAGAGFVTGLATGLEVLAMMGCGLGLGVALALGLELPLMLIFCPTESLEGFKPGFMLVNCETESP